MEAGGHRPSLQTVSVSSAAVFSGTVCRDVKFLSDDRMECLDAYLPDSQVWSGPHPVVVVIHGGGWAKGDKAERRQVEISRDLAANGYAVFAINYRLTEFSGEILKSAPTRSCWPDCLHDCREALRFASTQKAAWNLDPSRTALFGLSAGAHLALLCAVTTGHPELDRTDGSFPVSCVIYFYGVFKLPEIGARWRFGELHPDPAAVRRQASPATHLGTACPPVLVFHGDADATVPVTQSFELSRRLEDLKVPHRTRILEAAPHGFGIRSEAGDLRREILMFLGDHAGRPITVSSAADEVVS